MILADAAAMVKVERPRPGGSRLNENSWWNATTFRRGSTRQRLAAVRQNREDV